jgi:dienelactone hydrolase
MKRYCLVAAALMAMSGCARAVETLTFPSLDGLEVTADLYLAHPAEAPLILLFHMAGSSRAEYASIAPRLNRLGFNAMAVDQRSGGGRNETAKRAREAKKGTTYIHALPDMKAALAFARAKYARGKVILWGSSYSASLVLKMAGDDPASCDGVLAFSPGEYFVPPVSIEESAKGIKVPVFVSSAKFEGEDWKAIFAAIGAPGKESFLPEGGGAHGSEALAEETPGNAEYWKAVEPFLKRFLP